MKFGRAHLAALLLVVAVLGAFAAQPPQRPDPLSEPF